MFVTKTILKGTIIDVKGMPFFITQDTPLLGRPEYFEILDDYQGKPDHPPILKDDQSEIADVTGQSNVIDQNESNRALALKTELDTKVRTLEQTMLEIRKDLNRVLDR